MYKTTEEELFGMLTSNKTNGFMDLLPKLASIDCVDKYGNNLLLQAISEQQFVIAEELIKKGINLNHQNKNGKTALHYLSERPNIEIAKLMLAQGADVNIKDKHGNNALWYAVDNYDLVKLYLQYGANPLSENVSGRTPIYLAEFMDDKELVEILKAKLWKKN